MAPTLTVGHMEGRFTDESIGLVVSLTTTDGEEEEK
jgi:hypothetical protein